MKGSLHTDELMAEVVHKDTGIRTARRISHAFIMDAPTYPKPLFVTDAAVNILDSRMQNALAERASAVLAEAPQASVLSFVLVLVLQR